MYRRPTTSEEFAYHALRTDILVGRISAGTRIVQSEVAAQLDISVTPVREALRRLQSEGLVELTPHKGAMIGHLDIAKGREIYELRILLEPLIVARSITAISDERLDDLAQLCDAMDATSNVSEFAEFNQRFHDGLLVDDDSWGVRIVRMLRVASGPYVAYSLHAYENQMSQSNAEHRRMLRAYAARDADAARELTVHHLSSTVVILEDRLTDGVPTSGPPDTGENGPRTAA